MTRFLHQKGLFLASFPSQIVIVMSALLLATSGLSASERQPKLSKDDAIVISESYRLWQQFGEELWPGWTKIEMPMVYITESTEFAIGFPNQPSSFEKTEMRLQDKAVYFRARQLNPNLAASFPVEGVPSVVIGTPKALNASPTQWTLTAAHEMFHVLQMNRGSFQKVTTLKIVEEAGDGSWQLNFPFPYKDSDVMRLMHLEGYPLYLAVEQSETDAKVRYNAGTSRDATEVLKSFLAAKTGDDRAYHYALFQEWKEGVARYTEFRLAELAASSDYRASAAVRAMSDYQPYETIWKERYQNQVNLFKHAGRVARSRTEFYNVGLAKGLVLDQLDPDWKDSYFKPEVWLDGLLAEAIDSAALCVEEPTTK